ncbi:hypothetical protein PVK06_024055 [Gossypium arboreum]|uniref:RNase H type-1 domain-containing protein n=1 Tax=Gossypium arboreum TaxID=29729 RepID=A0ABR0PCS7_GOSAR|nr:hypothetical protein PVK06_024055 [Gossypium arboreum]
MLDFHSPSKTSCAGVVIRNRHGIVLGSHTVVCKHIPSAFVALPTTCLHVVHLGLALGFPYVIVEGDSLTVLCKVQSSRPDLSILDAYIQDMKFICAEGFGVGFSEDFSLLRRCLCALVWIATISLCACS